ncbi:MAG: HAD family phosphatase [Syntrophotalea acetylenica]|jgi:HAD superfamily hydrolase (TIGR01509 family)|uniref:HAD family hydrolase n=2 Tax=Syntrophotalea TaxID=2812025 RepID=UPI002A3EB44A|nr:HAD family phosphatase [Syntrophotalea acetylenica]
MTVAKRENAMLKGIFWDNDGILVDTEPLYYRAMQETLAEVGIPLPMDLYRRITLEEGRSSLCLAQEAGFSDADLSRLRDAKNARYSRMLQAGITPLAGAVEAVAALRPYVGMAIVTSSLRDHFELMHRHSGLPQQFDFILTREDFHNTKPHPEPYLKALARSGLRPEECIVIEDTRRGLEAARAAGLRCLVIPGGLAPDAAYPGAWKVAANLDMARRLLEGELAAETSFTESNFPI